MSTESPVRTQGKIITFYSYKGGTGRSMALANVAWILAASRKRVLVLDWDLEAPGLHRYFRPFLIDKDLTSSDGLIDFVIEFADEAIRPSDSGASSPDWYIPYADITRYALSIDFEGFPPPGGIDFVPAGRQSSTYAARVNSFNWQNFYDRLGGGAFLEAAKQHLRSDYDYILIDSRTGVSDTAGISTVQMPDMLVVCFTYNNQSIEGAAAVSKSALQARQRLTVEPDGNSFNIFPVPTRVERGELDKLEARQRYARKAFDDILNPKIERSIYWGEIEVPYVPFYNYEEVLATFKDESNNKNSVLYPLVRLTNYITNTEVSEFKFLISPETKLKILLEFAETPDSLSAAQAATPVVTETEAEELVRLAESAYQGLLTAENREESRRLWTRLVRVARPGEGGEHTRLRIRLKEFNPKAVSLIDYFALPRLLSVEQSSSESIVEIANEMLIRNWTRLRGWIENDLDFLVWRQKLRDPIQDWESAGRKDDYLLRGVALKEAEEWLNSRGTDLNDSEKEFIQAAFVKSQQEKQPRFTGGIRVFIIRPFGIKKGINFDDVERQLIDPALTALNMNSRTTGDSLMRGNVRTEMFQLLLTADVVIADISISDGNVFYELGIRHALRNKRTFMLRCTGSELSPDVPFDLQTSRYLSYDVANPGSALEKLTEGLRQTLDSSDADSPVFQLLPYLTEHDKSRFLAVPGDFLEEVERAKNQGNLRNQWGDLKLLQTELRGFTWEVEGLRSVGRVQFSKRAYEYARDTWESVRKYEPNDIEANTLLGTTYQRLGDLTESNLALQRVLDDTSTTQSDRAEAYSLIGRNLKEKWKEQWTNLPAEQRKEAALRSPFLKESYDQYKMGFAEDLNHYYSGINALGMLTVMTEMATALPDVWNGGFDEDDEGERELKKLNDELTQLRGIVTLTLNLVKARAGRAGTEDIWLKITLADLACLTSKRPTYVADQYSKALAGADDFVIDAVRRQLVVYEQLGVIESNVAAALKALLVPAAHEWPSLEPPYVLLFAGHRIDSLTRTEPRFPANKESVARFAIKDAIEKELARVGGQVIGIAGGASGGDIIFHEVCAELNIPTTLYLVMPRTEYVKESVQDAGPEWIDRFNALYRLLQRRELSDSAELPRWLQNKHNYTIWNRNNLWMLYNAMALGSQYTTLIALWDGKAGDGPGGTQDMINKAEDKGAKTIKLNTKELFGL